MAGPGCHFVGGAAAVALFFTVACPFHAEGHAYLYEPPSRNLVAKMGGHETCSHCLQAGGPDAVKARGGGPAVWPSVLKPESHGLCGDPVQNAPEPKGIADEPYMEPTPVQRTYTAGSVVEFKVGVATHHWGHYEFRLCDRELNKSMSSKGLGQECLNAHTLHRAPRSASCGDKTLGDCQYNNPQHPERWYLPPPGSDTPQVAGADWNDDDALPSTNNDEVHSMKFVIPANVTCEHCTLQWYYSTGNACAYDADYLTFDPGFKFWNFYKEPWATEKNTVCGPNATGRFGEEFWNCADVRVEPAGSSPPPAPVSAPAAAPVSQPAAEPAAAPVPQPEASPAAAPAPQPGPVPEPEPDTPAAQGIFTTTTVGLSKTRLFAFRDAHTSQPVIGSEARAVHSSGGAAGGVVSEGQAYGLLFSGIVFAALDEGDADRDTVMDLTYSFFLGWRRMAELSGNSGSCQEDEGFKCGGGQYPCLPHWKFGNDLTAVVGKGAAPDGDADALAGMLLTIMSLEASTSQPSWYSDMASWAYETCMQFYLSATVDSSSGEHRIVKLGSCWGGWNSDGQNPSYHAPAVYRMCRDFMRTHDGTYGASATEGDSYEAGWDKVIDTSYEVLDAVQCPSSGLVPNWAKVYEESDLSLTASTGFSGSGTPGAEYGAEAARTVWRVALDYLLYPDEAASAAGAFLSPLVASLETKESSGQWSNLDVDDTCLVDAVFGSWERNAFIAGPTFASLVWPSDSVPSARQQELIDGAGTRIAGFDVSNYYAASWTVMTTVTLNGDVSKAAIRAGLGAPTSPTPSSAPTSAPPTATPSAAPTAAPTSAAPTAATTSTPSAATTSAPSLAPSSAPTPAPSSVPSAAQTLAPSAVPSTAPTAEPSPATPDDTGCHNPLCGCPPFSGKPSWCHNGGARGYGAFCEESENQCTNACAAIWCAGDAGVPSPTPTAQGDQDACRNKDCGCPPYNSMSWCSKHSVIAGWCSESKSNCGVCNHVWCGASLAQVRVETKAGAAPVRRHQFLAKGNVMLQLGVNETLAVVDGSYEEVVDGPDKSADEL
mmetsp:Transcript_101277/g.285520  ORF Transcript_101277/g.285520 Transcript_101277/m.285520 type:complete len:1052 (-) Transcript_101277:131-3286(-)